MTQSPLDSDPQQLPTHRLTPDEFEDFTERLLSAHRSCARELRRIARVERWGRRGDKQDGIDFEGTWSDGQSAAWQCKRYVRLTEKQIQKFVSECTFRADEYYLTFSGEASSLNRIEMAKHPKWQLLDRRGLLQLFDDLPLQRKRQVLDATWGLQFRKSFLKVPGEDALLPIEDYAESRQDPENLLNDSGPLVGRTDELQALTTALKREADWPPLILVTGPGGRGKSRLVSHVLQDYALVDRTLPVLAAMPGRLWDGHALSELPLTPAVIWVDDAHRDPKALRPLLDYARRTKGTQLVFSSRSSGRDQVRAELIESGTRVDQIQELEVGRLSRMEARGLVRSLSDGIRIPAAVVEHLAEQAEDSPFVAVLALNLARRGKLEGPLALAQGLREQVLLRYQTVLTTNLGSFSEETVRRILATYAAIGPVEDGDQNLRSVLGSFCGLTSAEFLRLARGLKDRGLLVSRSGFTRVAPDILADQILEAESMIDGVDTGFVSELWTEFGDVSRERLVVSLSELDWRLTRRGNPSLIAQVETALYDEIQKGTISGLYSMVQGLGPLSYTQPLLLIGLLEDVRKRLSTLSQGLDESAQPTSMNESHGISGGLPGLAPTSVSDVEHKLAGMYGQCASNEPEVFERAMDALWALGRHDHRATHAYPDHPLRVLTDKLADLGVLPDPSFPERIVAKVQAWLEMPSEPGDSVTPLFLLAPLLEKEGSRYVSTTRRTISIRPFLVPPQTARPWRDAIRGILAAQAVGPDVRRARKAVELLGHALLEPKGTFGMEVDDEDVQSWKDDDLETLKTISSASAASEYAIIRRIIRRQVQWSAQYSRIPQKRHAALTLLVGLDARGDDLAEVLLGLGSSILENFGDQKIPTMAELQKSMSEEAEARTERSDDEQEAERLIRIRRQIKLRDKQRTERLERVVRLLAPDAQPEVALTEIELLCRQIQLSTDPSTDVPGLTPLFEAIAKKHANRAGDLAVAISGREAGPLDQGLPVLLDAWSRRDPEATLAWLDVLATQRSEIRQAVAATYSRYGWIHRGERFFAVFLVETEDPDNEVRNQYLQASHDLLRAEPVETVKLLLKSGVSPSAATRVLQGASEFDGIGWGRSLEESHAIAVLSLINKATLRDESVQLISAGIAQNFPRRVMDHLMSYKSLSDLPFGIAGLPETLKNETVELTAWLMEQVSIPFNPKAMTVFGLVMAGGMSQPQASTIADEVDALDAPALLNLTNMLYDVPLWASRCPLLARRMLSRALALGSEVVEEVRVGLSEGMRYHLVGYENGVSEELESSLVAVEGAAAAEPLDALRDEYRKMATQISSEISEAARRFEEEYGNE